MKRIYKVGRLNKKGCGKNVSEAFLCTGGSPLVGNIFVLEKSAFFPVADPH